MTVEFFLELVDDFSQSQLINASNQQDPSVKAPIIRGTLKVILLVKASQIIMI